jgi:hypothetical protein
VDGVAPLLVRRLERCDGQAEAEHRLRRNAKMRSLVWSDRILGANSWRGDANWRGNVAATSGSCGRRRCRPRYDWVA